MPETASRHVCSYPAQPFADDGIRNDRGRCLVPGCTQQRGRTVPVDEALLRSALRDALAFAQFHDFSGDPQSKRFIAEYETALLQLSDAPDAGMDVPRVLAIVTAADAWLDGAVAGTYEDQPLAQDWARVAKVAEEAGEAVSALIAYSGQNPRKGVCGSRDDLLGELADAFCTGILAIQHFTKDPQQTWAVVSRSLEKLEARSAAWIAEASHV